ncbi:MAG: isochorismatase family cysteine hydrolase [Acidaminobacteraceae bacterium]
MIECIEQIKIKYKNLNYYDRSLLKEGNTVLVVVDMTNGFVKEGNLYSDRVEKIIDPVIEYINMFANFQKLYFLDEHKKNAKEFHAFPPHGIGKEGNLIAELELLIDGKSVKISKNSINGFFAPEFGDWLQINFKDINNYVIVGDCTDLCVMQFALSVKAFYNQWEIESNVIIPINAVETFDLKETFHDGELMNLFAFYNMELNGINIVKGISD